MWHGLLRVVGACARVGDAFGVGLPLQALLCAGSCVLVGSFFGRGAAACVFVSFRCNVFRVSAKESLVGLPLDVGASLFVAQLRSPLL